MTKVVIFGCQKICIEFVKYLKNEKNSETRYFLFC